MSKISVKATSQAKQLSFQLLTAACLLLSLAPAAKAGPAAEGYQQSIVSCVTVCVQKASAPRPGKTPKGHLALECFNNLTGQFVGDRPLPDTPCGR